MIISSLSALFGPWLRRLVLTTAALAAPAWATPALQLAAAADLATCIAEINRGFTAAHAGVEVKTSIGSSGNFYAQIRNGAPYDVFLSADTFYPRELARAGLADGATLTVYAHGRLVLWSTDPMVDVASGLAVLKNPAVSRIALANPEVAPYGRAAKVALENAGLWEALKDKLVFGENVAQAAQFVETGNAQAGFVGSAHVRKESGGAKGRAWPVPQTLYPLLEQAGIVTARGRANPAAAAYLRYLRSAQGRAILRKYGFALPDQAAQ